MMTYKIKPEYLDLWEGGDSPSDPDRIITDDELASFAREWDTPIAELLEQLIPMESKLWYAVQRDREDDWGTGSYSLDEAISMAKRQMADYPDTLIAVIDNSTENAVCVDEITEF